MSDLLEVIMRQMYLRDHLSCPFCKGEIDMTDSERLMGHVTFWGEDEPTTEHCPKCGERVYLKEHVERSWTIGKTPDDATHDC